jgi:protein disulfide-isomerase
MQATRWLWCLVLVGWGLVASASAQQGIRWQVDLETAKRLAAQTNRMVLIHFWADWCLPCRQMEKAVFARPEVAAAMESRFIPVKLNADHFPHTRQQYGVTVLPSDVIIAPDGQVVGKIVGGADASRYVAQLSQIAGAAGNRGQRSYDGRKSGNALASRQTATPGSGGFPAAQRVSQGLSPSDSRNGRLAGPIGDGHPAQTVASGPSAARSAAAVSGRALGIKIPPSTGVAGHPSSAVAAGTQSVPQGMSVPPDVVGAGSRSSPSGIRDAATQPPARPHPWPRVQIPTGNPPLGLDGYCPVELTDHQRWVGGDPRWGLIHRGRTYLFAGPEQRDRFNETPDRYAPVLSGSDVVLAVDEGASVPGRREHGAWFEQHVYLFSSEATLRKFDAAPDRYVSALLEGRENMARRPIYGAPAVHDTRAGSDPQAPYQRRR